MNIMEISKNQYNRFRIKEIRDLIKCKLDELEKLDDIFMKEICLFSLIDMFAQNSKYGNNDTEQFTTFIEKYGNEALLQKIDPDTLYCENKQYFINNQIDIAKLFNDATEYSWHDIQNNGISAQIINLARKDANLRDKVDKHKYSRLIYKWRSKLVHEFNSPSVVFKSMQNYEYPFYYSMINKIHQLVFPYEFLKNLFLTSIRNYLNECDQNNNDPFYFSNIHYETWYE